MIPKIIHQTWKDKIIPKQWQISQDEWLRLHPTWSYRLWTDSDLRDFIANDYSWFLDTYDSYPHHIQRVDAARYFILHKYGGLYSDLDIQPVKEFDDIIKVNSVLLVITPNLNYVTNYLMASPAGDEFWLHVFKELKHRSSNTSWWWLGKHLLVMNTTGPMMLDKAVKSYKGSVSFMPTCVISQNVCGEINCMKSYTKTLKGGSWHSFDSKFYNWYYCNRILLIIIVVVILLLIIILVVVKLTKK